MNDTMRTRQIAETVAANLRRLRSQQNVSISDLARRAGLSKAAIVKLETGQGNPTIHTVAALADILHVSPGDLLMNSSPELLRAGEGPVLGSNAMTGRVISKISGSAMEMYDVTVHAGQVHRSEHLTAGEIEQLYLISGTLEVTVGETSMVLRKGDAVRYSLDQPLSFAAKGGDAHAIIVLVITSTGSSGGPKSSVQAAVTTRSKRTR
jgi:transcriptional regulator with XRE-family HTH domain